MALRTPSNARNQSPGDGEPVSSKRLPTARLSTASRARETRRSNRGRQLSLILDRGAHEANAVAMNPVTFVQAMLPHKEQYTVDTHGERVHITGADGKPMPLLANSYAARNGTFTLSVRSGTKKGPSHLHPEVARGIPYGGLARLLLCYVITEAQKRDSRQIDLGATLTGFCQRVDITPSGGKNGRIGYVVDQMQRLATAVMDYRWDTVEGPRAHQRGESLLFVDSYHFWHQSASQATEPADGGTITLSERFWREIVSEKCFPLDFRKAQYFRAYPTAYDLYLWLTYRLNALQMSGRAEVALNYDQLHEQLGSHYQTDEEGTLTLEGKKNFGKRVRKALIEIRKTWPELRVATPRGRVVVHASSGPDVGYRPPRRPSP